MTDVRSQEYVTEAWEALLTRGDCACIQYRAGLVADAESCNQLGIRSRPTTDGTVHEVFVVRPDGTELPPFDGCVVRP